MREARENRSVALEQSISCPSQAYYYGFVGEILKCLRLFRFLYTFLLLEIKTQQKKKAFIFSCAPNFQL